MENKNEFDKLNWRYFLPSTVEVDGKDCLSVLSIYRLSESKTQSDVEKGSFLKHIVDCPRCRSIWEATQRVETQTSESTQSDLIDRIHDFYGVGSQSTDAEKRLEKELSDFEIEPIDWLEGKEGSRIGIIPSYRSVIIVIDQLDDIAAPTKPTVKISFEENLDEVVLLPDQFGNDLYLWYPVFQRASITVRVNGCEWKTVAIDRSSFEPELLFLAVVRMPAVSDHLWEKLAGIDDRVFRLQQGKTKPSDSRIDCFYESADDSDAMLQPALVRDRRSAAAKDLMGQGPTAGESTSVPRTVAVFVCGSWDDIAQRKVSAVVTSPLEVEEHEWRFAIELTDDSLEGAIVRLMAQGAVMGVATVENRRISWWQQWPNQRVPKNLFQSLEVRLLESNKN